MRTVVPESSRAPVKARRISCFLIAYIAKHYDRLI
jgi:hypothetical protein